MKDACRCTSHWHVASWQLTQQQLLAVCPRHRTESSACPCLQSAKQIIELLEVSLTILCSLPMSADSSPSPLMPAAARPANLHGPQPTQPPLAAQQRLLQNCMLAKRQSSIVPAGCEPVPVAHPAACRVLRCAGLQKEESDLTDDDIAHMKHVNSYCKVQLWHAQGLFHSGVVNAAVVLCFAQIGFQAHPVLSLSSLLLLCASL